MVQTVLPEQVSVQFMCKMLGDDFGSECGDSGTAMAMQFDVDNERLNCICLGLIEVESDYIVIDTMHKMHTNGLLQYILYL